VHEATDVEVQRLASVPSELLGFWQRVDSDKPHHYVKVTDDLWSEAFGGALRFSEPLLGANGQGDLVRVIWANAIEVEWQLDGNDLMITYTHERNKFAPNPETQVESFRRLDEPRPEFEDSAVRISPTSGAVTEQRRQEVSAELIRRMDLDQAIRSFVDEGRPPSAEESARMEEIDADNTQYLLELISEVGWIDAGQFGDEATLGAFVIVQHSGHLPLMRAALPYLQAEALRNSGFARNFTMLFDRTQLYSGNHQRYGTQFGLNREGMFLQPIESREDADTHLRALGLPSLAEKLEGLKGANDGREIEILTEWPLPIED